MESEISAIADMCEGRKQAELSLFLDKLLSVSLHF